MIAWLQQLPPFSLAVVCSGAFVLLTWFGIIFVRPFLRLPLRRQPGANDLVSYTSSWFSLLYGLLLGLLAVATYQNASQIQTSVQREAATLALLYRGSASYPEPLRSELQFLLRDYTLYVVHKDWPAHEEGRFLPGGAARMGALVYTLATFEPTTKAQEVMLAQTFANLDALAEARIERLAGVVLTIPGVFWYVVLIGALINIVLIWMLEMRFFTHLILGGMISFFLGVMFFLLIALDQPLRGAVAVSPGSYELAYRVLMEPDEGL
jgi:hypothetical protein